MKIWKINENTNLELDQRSERYELSLSRKGEVLRYFTEFSPITSRQIQKLVDKLVRLGMITLKGDDDDWTLVSVVIWVIDETDDLYIETYHESIDGDLCDEDRTMKYDEFLNSK